MHISTADIPVPDMDDVRRVGRSIADRIEDDPRVKRFRRRRRIRRWKSKLVGDAPPQGLVTGLAVVSILTGLAAALLELRRR